MKKVTAQGSVVLAAFLRAKMLHEPKVANEIASQSSAPPSRRPEPFGANYQAIKSCPTAVTEFTFSKTTLMA
jgi:hypothetical protein